MPTPSTSTIGVLASGGLDSTILVARLLDKENASSRFTSIPTYTGSRQNWRRCNASWAAIAKPELAEIVEIQLPLADLYSGHWSLTGRQTPGSQSPDEAVYLPGRNLLLAMKPALWCQMHGIGRLALGVLGSRPL